MKFVVHLKGSGQGCDYTIGCNQKTIELPATIKTLGDAYKYVVGDPDDEDSGLINDYGKDSIKTAIIYCVVDEAEIDIDELIRKQEIVAIAKKAEMQQLHDEAEFNRLKEKLGK